MAARICIIFNPAARGEKARRFRKQLGALASQCALKPTAASGGGRALAAEAVREGYETIVAAGGDGTVNEVINGLGDEPGGFTRARLAVLPLGTVNVFAREIKVPAAFDAAWEIVQHGQELRLDLGKAECIQNNQPAQRHFVQLAGAGFDSRAIELVDWELKKKLGAFAYILAGLKAMRKPFPPIVARGEGKELTGELVLVGNGRFYGGSFHLFPLADAQDGLLEVTVFPHVNVWAILRAGFGIVFRQIYRLGGAQHFNAAQLSLSCTEEMPFQVEGENAGFLPARFSVSPRALRVLAPPAR